MPTREPLDCFQLEQCRAMDEQVDEIVVAKTLERDTNRHFAPSAQQSTLDGAMINFFAQKSSKLISHCENRFHCFIGDRREFLLRWPSKFSINCD